MPRPYKRIKPASHTVKMFAFSTKDWTELDRLFGERTGTVKQRTESLLTEAIARERTDKARRESKARGAPKRDALRFAVKGLIKIFRGYYRPPKKPAMPPKPYALRRLETAFVRRCLAHAKLIKPIHAKSMAPSLKWYLEDARLSGSRLDALEKIADRVDEELGRVE